MKLLVVAATQQEIAGFYNHFDLREDRFISTPNFDVLVTGVGMVATAFSLGRHLHKGYDLALNVGIAGSFDATLTLGSLAQVSSDSFAELGAEDHDVFLSIDELGFGKSTFSATADLPILPKATAITVNKVHGHADSITKIRQLFPVQLESMEGAAFFYACEAAQVRCAQVRSISNYVEPRDKARWEIGRAINNLNDWLIPFVEAY